MGCGCCGGPLIGCSPALCQCDTSNVYRVVPIGILGTCCPRWNQTWDMEWISGSVPSFNIGCAWRHSRAGTSCTRGAVHLVVTFDNPCRVYLEFSDSSTALIFSNDLTNANLHALYSCDDFDCDSSNVFGNRYLNASATNVCTGWPLEYTVSLVP